MATVHLDTQRITDRESFHFVCQKVFGFPDFYGMNMDAWIDCMSSLDDDAKMTRFALAEDEVLTIQVSDTEDFNKRLPEVFDLLVECTSFVNRRYVEQHQLPRIALVFV